MLKRPRLPSPPLSQEGPQLPIPIDTPNSLFHTKRRRTLGPIIDSHERGDICLSDDDDDGEDNIIETDIERDAPDASDVVVQQYEHVNGFLHKLHFQKQRFNPTSPQADTSHADGQPLEKKNSKTSSVLPNVLRENTPPSRESAFQNTARFVDDRAREQREHISGFQPQARPVLALDLKEERLSVANNYEDSNRYVYFREF